MIYLKKIIVDFVYRHGLKLFFRPRLCGFNCLAPLLL